MGLVRHISIRVPWHDAGWDGTVCRKPTENGACLILKRIHDEKVDIAEEGVAGRIIDDLGEGQRPPCVSERVGFMLGRAFKFVRRHPYAEWSPAHQHLKAATLTLPPYSAGAVPFRRMLRENAPELAAGEGLNYVQDLEDLADREIGGRSTAWVQHGENQTALLKSFFAPIVPRDSLCFFYAKRTPLADDPRRVIIGAGRVAKVGDPTLYPGSMDGPFPSSVWDVPVEHTIRANHADGFLLPYHEALEAAAEGGSIDPAEIVAFAPDEGWAQFSFATEQVTHDVAIASLASCAAALGRAEGLLPGARGVELGWIAERMSELWGLRGPCPGLGPALSAFGVDHGTLLAYRLAAQIGENEEPWPLIERLFDDPRRVLPGAEKQVKHTVRKAWQQLDPERKALLKLLSRFELTEVQAERLYQPTERDAAGISATDAELLENPYLLYELDRPSLDPIPVPVIDRGAFPAEVVREKHPLPPPSDIGDPIDRRRVRALLVDELESAGGAGDTLRPLDRLIKQVHDRELDPPCRLSIDLFAAVKDHLPPLIADAELDGGAPALQLDRLARTRSIIAAEVRKRRAAKAIVVADAWSALLAEELPELQEEGTAEREAEDRARHEKVAALAMLGRSRVACLVGPAGTGKTTLLAALCAHPEVARGGILLLAPTGKARVQLSTRITLPEGQRPMTIAQFLNSSGRFLGDTGVYRVLPGVGKEGGYRTVVIDEASMLTEEMLAAVIDALVGVERLVLVGDPRQLPPIGAGRPFVDLVRELAPPDVQRFPRVADNYAELTVPRRPLDESGESGYEAQRRHDLMLAEWFSDRPPTPGADEIWERLRSRDLDATLSVETWTDATDLQTKLLEALAAELKLTGPGDGKGFERNALGAVESGGNHYFNAGRRDAAGNLAPAAGAAVERWQILAPVRATGHGVSGLNHFMQRQYRQPMLDFAGQPFTKLIPRPMGAEQVVYGDKVMCIRNRPTRHVYPGDDALEFVANGEIGAVVGVCTNKWKKRPNKLEVELSTQQGFKYSFFAGEFGEEGTPPIELAYAITVHKAQGSEFDSTFLVIPDPCPILSRELLYTALTRQRRRVHLFFQGSITHLYDLAGPEASATQKRITNLFVAPKPVKVRDSFLEAGLIHQTADGKLVRSKSEVIIADRLFAHGVEYAYEAVLEAPNGSIRRPDFFIDDAATGRSIYWEHLGMLEDPIYAERWKRKLAWYEAIGISEASDGAPEGGDGGLLIVTTDDDKGGISSQAIEELVIELFG